MHINTGLFVYLKTVLQLIVCSPRLNTTFIAFLMDMQWHIHDLALRHIQCLLLFALCGLQIIDQKCPKLTVIVQQQAPWNVAGNNFYETRSRTKVFGLSNEHGCIFCIQIYVDNLKYAGKLNNRQIKNAYVMICNIKKILVFLISLVFHIWRFICWLHYGMEWWDMGWWDFTPFFRHLNWSDTPIDPTPH